MTDHGSPHAYEISVAETLDLLNGPFASLSSGVCNGGFAFWLGSSISRDRVPGLGPLLERVIAHLQSRITPADADCPFRAAVERIVALARPTATEVTEVLPGVPIESWSCKEEILNRLGHVYSKVMNVRVDGEDDDYLLWTAADVTSLYAAASLEPDVEHLCMAILMFEGVAPTVVTANWDGLIEASMLRLSAVDPPLRVCVTGSDLREPEQPSSLFKIHGCAVLAREDPSTYREHLIVREPQIVDWPNSHEYAAMRHQIVAIAVQKPTLMIGLSAQDPNIKAVFSVAKEQMGWPWPAESLSHVFAEDELGTDQESILQFTYREAYRDHRTEIEESALLRAYAKPLLVALVLCVATAKVEALAKLAARDLPPDESERLAGALRFVRNSLAGHAEGDRLAFIEGAIGAVANAMALLNGGPFDGVMPAGYHSISPTPLHQLEQDQAAVVDGRPQAALALALVACGIEDGSWSVAPPDSAAGCFETLKVTGTSGTSKVVLVANAGALIRLEQKGLVDFESANTVVVHSAAVTESIRRSPVDAPGRTLEVRARTVSMQDVAGAGGSLDGIRDRFQQEAML